MNVSLPTKDFGFFKVVVGSLFLICALCLPSIAVYSFGIALLVGRAHSMGAWVGMWRAGKLNWIYVSWMLFLSVVISYWGLKMTSLTFLNYFTYLLFAFHYFFDEFDLQDEKRILSNILPSISPFVLTVLYLADDYYRLGIGLSTFIAIAVALTIAELLFTKEINWLVVQMKLLTLFILGSILFGVSANAILNIFLISHYFFWFVYPVYKMHKYKRAERDGLIMILILIVATSMFFAFTKASASPDLIEIAERTFLVGTIVHIIATAPFGYIFGLPRPKKYPAVQSSTT